MGANLPPRDDIMPLPRVLILHNEPTLPADHPDADSEHDILYTADTVGRILQQAGLPVSRLGVTTDPTALIAGISAAAPDVVFNLYEGTAKWGNAEAYVSGILELLRLPYTGSPTQPLLLCRSKPLTKQLLAGSGLPTAPFLVVEGKPVPENPHGWPVIVKPGLEDASVGIDQKSVVTSQAELEERVEYVIRTYNGPALVEKFIRGREFNCALIATRGHLEALPFSEILFVPPPETPDLWPIVSFDAKWHPGTRDFVATPAKNPAEVSPGLHEKVATAARRAFELVGCRDYARVDFRVDDQENIFVLEVNPNPCISPLAGLAAGLESAKIPYSAFILGLVRNALRRSANPALAESVPEDVPATSHPAAISAAPRNDEKPTAAKPKRAKKSPYRVRQARKADAPAIANLLASPDLFPPAERNRLLTALGRGNRNGWRFLVLAGKGEVVGFAALRSTDATDGAVWLETLVISANHRRSGHGMEFLRSLETSALEIGGRFLLADVSSAVWFGPGRQFLGQAGFRSVGEIADFYRDGYSRISFAKALPIPTPPEPAQSEANSESGQAPVENRPAAVHNP